MLQLMKSRSLQRWCGSTREFISILSGMMLNSLREQLAWGFATLVIAGIVRKT